jgi:7-carboxy-7-deazaguanine synthase
MIQIAEIFYSLQGEGTHTGTAAIFVRLAGCNLSCSFCDTDYSVKELKTVEQIVNSVQELAPECPMVIVTGGEPLIQSDTIELVSALQRDGRRVHIESNGTMAAKLPEGVWLTISPKTRLHPTMAMRANEAKLIVDGRVPIEWMRSFPKSTPVFLQPEGNKRSNIDLAVSAVQADPTRLRLSLQTHKFINIR